MTAQLRIGVARVPQRRSGRPVDARAEATRLAERLPDEPGLLVIRHLEVLPGSDSAGRDRVETLRRTARRPALEPVPPGASAVWFADEVELLVCLSDDLARGRAREHWWWRGRVRRAAGSDAEVLETAWLRDARWVPAAVAALHRVTPARAAAAVALLDPVAATRVRRAVLAEHGMAPPVGRTPADPAAAAPDARGAVHPATVRARAATGPAPVDAAVARLHPEARALLETALLLEAPTTPASRPSPEPPAEERPPPPTYDVAEPPTLHLVAAVADAPGAAAAPVARAAGAARRPAAAAEDRPDDPDRPDRTPRAPGEVVPLRARPAAGRPVPGSGPDDGEPPPWQHHPWQASGPAVPTGLASLLYAVNLLPVLDRAPPRPGTGWAVVEALGRWLLRQVPAARRRELLQDPLLPLLATLDGREPDVPTPVRLGAATRPVRALLHRHGVGAEAFLQPGRVLVSRTHVDVLLLLDQADVRVRATGLDQDPGWVPALGRIVLFHFEDAT
ncbi:hypothetical protein ASC77_09420 [Nocardioides sp. Root1257]|uniref:hypothetical protein n=1 Tax=unclassified Nocardioides TaxID=2615069 RepID=UPI0006F55FB6|nr:MULTISPECIES: hypothetical protein [unclassified Nocardioides]KQW48928.1 hypothetical protein ASC77_09420 [Nocardioides sp. Root1257]KRC48103.1 hypothetical protein ASE24_09425 [Nocardioides sp. Root224]